MESLQCYQVNLWLTRHGETFTNIQHKIGGHDPGELTKKGNEQTSKLGLRLKAQKFDFTYCSDLNRCVQTLENIKKETQHKNNFTKSKIKFEPRLRERAYGVMTG